MSLLLLIVLAAASVRLWQLGESLWLDELHTAWVVAASSQHDMVRRAQLGNQSPLYFYLPTLTVAVLGDSEWTLRLPSIVAGLGTVVLVYYVVLQWTASATCGLTAAALVAVDHHAIFYAQEARPYALAQFTALLHVFLFWSIQKRPGPGRRLAGVLLGVFLFWLHYTTALLLLGETGWYLMLLARGKTNYRPFAFATDAAVLLIGTLPALPHLFQIANHRDDWSMFVNRLSPVAAVRWFSLDAYLLMPLAMVAGALLLGRLITTRTWRISATALAGPWMLVVVWFIVPVLVTWLLTWMDIARLFFPRYLICSAIAPIVLAGMSVSLLAQPAARAAVAGAVVVTSVLSSGLVPQYMRDGRLLADRNQDWRGAVSWLNRSPELGTAHVLVRSGLLEADRLAESSPPLLKQYCLLPVTGLYRLSVPPQRLIPLRTADAGNLGAETMDRIAVLGDAWLIINGSRRSQSRVVVQLQEAFARQGFSWHLAEQRRFGDIQVLRVQVRRA